jgi:hypothetical protein
MYSNIPTILAQQDFNNRHADMLASARGEVSCDILTVEYYLQRWRPLNIKPEWCLNIPDIKYV